MSTYYVGPGGNNANAGTSWALRKLTLNGAEDIPVAAGDTVYVGPGTYREMLTADVSGSNGSPITYIGDYTGVNTDGIGGIVRITGSNNDVNAFFNRCISISYIDYRAFSGFHLDGALFDLIRIYGGCSEITVSQCVFGVQKANYPQISSEVLSGTTIRKCVFYPTRYSSVYFSADSTGTSKMSVVEDCIFLGASYAIYVNRTGNILVRNSSLLGGYRHVYIENAPTAGEKITVNNCILTGAIGTSLTGKAGGYLIENYNAFYGNSTDRSSVATGANSNAYPPLFDSRWFFEAVNGGNMVTPFDLASYSQLVNVAGTSPTTTDMRGTSVIGAQREWGALEYDPNLDIEAGSGGGAVSISPWQGNIG